jgi:hypothetical protein
MEENGWQGSNFVRHAINSETDLAVLFDNNSTEEEEQVSGTGHLSEDHNREEWIRCANYLRWACTLCAGMEENFVCAPCHR